MSQHDGELFEAASHGDLVLVEQAIQNGANPMALRSYSAGKNSLHMACLGGHLNVVQYLLNSHPVNVEAMDNYGWTAFHVACFNGHVEIARLFVHRKRDCIFDRNLHGRSPFEIAKSENRTDVVEFVLGHYEEIIFERAGQFAIHWLLREASYDTTDDEDDNTEVAHLPVGEVTLDQTVNLLRALIARTPAHTNLLQTVDNNDNSRNTPVHIACHTRAPIQLMRVLVEADAVPLQLMNDAGALPIHIACENQAGLEVIQFLVLWGGTATLQYRNAAGALPIHVACANRAPLEVIQFLVQRGGVGTLLQQDGNQCLPIHGASRASAQLDIFQYLVQNGGRSTLAAEDGNGMLPLHLFCGSDPSLQDIMLLERAYPGFQGTRAGNGDWPVLMAAAAAQADDDSLDLIGRLLRIQPDVIVAFEDETTASQDPKKKRARTN